jgi:hypothetical protein
LGQSQPFLGNLAGLPLQRAPCGNPGRFLQHPGQFGSINAGDGKHLTGIPAADGFIAEPPCISLALNGACQITSELFYVPD